MFMGVEGVLWSGPVADGLAFILALVLILYEINKLKHMPSAKEMLDADGAEQ